ncbi:MAG: lamin tail domain-containing protein [Planctomycetota bacterium]
MSKNLALPILAISLFAQATSTSAFPLKVDIGDIGQPIKTGWEPITGNHNNNEPPETFLVDGLNITVGIVVGTGVCGYRDYGGGDLGGDMVYPDSGTGPLGGRTILTLSDLPAAAFTLTSYHNDTKSSHAQQDPIFVTVSGAVSSSTTALDVIQTKSLDDNNLGNSTVTFETTGTGDVVITYTPTTNDGLVSKAVLNGFELDLSGPVTPKLEFDSASSSGLESVSPAILTVTLTPPTDQYVFVNYGIGSGTAIGGGIDYTLTPGMLIFEPNQTEPEYINIDIVDDQIADGDKTIEIILSGPVNAQLGDIDRHTYTIIDTNPTVSFTTSASEAREDIPTAYIGVTLSHTWDDYVSVDYNATGGSAINGQNYSLAPGTLVFDPCEVTKNIQLTLIDNEQNDYPYKTIEITLSSPSGATLGAIEQHTFTILPPIIYPKRCPIGDLDGDCTVDYNDLKILSAQWLDLPWSCAGPGCADLDRSDGVNMIDYALLVGSWGQTGLPLVINEFMASNQRTQSDPNEPDDYPDWIELHNAGQTPIDISRMYLTDNVAEPNKWQIPEGTTIDAGEYMLFWADSDLEQGDTHTNFRLNESGEQVALFDSNGSTLLDVVYFDGQRQGEDVSYGRYPDGSANWRNFDMATDPHPTPGRANEGFDIIISEIMYHPSSHDPNEEYIEIYNRGSNTVDLNDWQFTDGVDFNFPAVSIPPDGFVVIAANSTGFTAKYPAVTNMVGSWSGKLSNMGESIELTNSEGTRIDKVHYADEGDWSARLRGPLDYGHYGWLWSDAHDGDGKSLELINSEQTNWYGQNWTQSSPDQGTPGTVNSATAGDIAPMILEVGHSPIMPEPNDSVTVTATIIDELFSGIIVNLYHRVDDTGSPFTSMSMYDDGLHGDSEAGDGIYGAVLSAQPDLSVVEFYVEATDSGANSRKWPSPVPGFGQATNLLYQVNASYDPCEPWIPSSQPIYYLVLTEQERAELEDLGDDSDNNEDLSDAQMNATFISRDATGIEVRYDVGVRNRGHGSRHEPPMNYRVNFPHDTPWKDITAINLNSKFAHLQWLGSKTFQLAGIPAPDTTIIQVRVNSENLVLADSRAYGSYVAVETKNSDWARNHIPDDRQGNVYRCIRESTENQADLRYEGTDPNAYRDTYFKRSNEEYDDWNDLITLTDVLNNAPDPNYFEDVNEVINIDEWMRYLALDTLMINCESGLNTGQGDDYGMYRGVNDSRFILVNHDQDTYLRQGDHPECDENHDIFTYWQVDGIYRLLNDPNIIPFYYQSFFDLIGTVYNPQAMNQLIDDGLSDYVPQSRRDAMKQVIVDRTAGVLAQIPYQFTINSPLSIVNGYYYTTSATTTLSGTANAAVTRSVLINGQLADFSALYGTWSTPGSITLNPGINRIQVEAFAGPGGMGSLVNSGYVDIWYNDATESLLSGTIATNTTLSTVAGPWHVTGDVTVQTGVTLAIEEGTTVFFDSGTGITINGRILAQGTQYEHIRLTSVPGGSNWDGLSFNNSIEESQLVYVDMEYGDSQGESILINNSQVLLDNVTWSGTNNTILEVTNPYITISNSVFPSISDSEVIHGDTMPPDGYFILENNTFNAITGNADVIDFSGGKRPGPILQAYNNIFLGGEDDGFDLDGTDAHIEGNIFKDFHFAGGDPTGTSNAIATGQASGDNSEIVAVRNIFYSVDHASLIKEGCLLEAENNLFYGCTVAVLNFDEPGHASGPGFAAYLDGNIFYKNTDLFQNFDPPVIVTVDRSIIPSEAHYLGTDNIDADPLLSDPNNEEFTLEPGSPAIGTGSNGLDMGAMVQAGVSISGEPPEITWNTSATLTVAGPGIVAYKYKVNSEPTWSSERAINLTIQLTSLTDGMSYTVYAIGKNSAGTWQDANEPTVSKTWTIDTNAAPVPGNVVINELLSHSDAPPSVDWIELHNTTNTEIDISGWFLSDSNSDPNKYQIANGTSIGPKDYIVFYEDLHFGSGSGDPVKTVKRCICRQVFQANLR